MKISMIGAGHTSGGKRHVKALSEELRKTGNDVTMIWDDEHVFTLRPPSLRHYSLRLRKYRLLKLLERQSPDIVHFHIPGGLYDFAIEDVTKRLGVPVVATIHLALGRRSFYDRMVGAYFRLLKSDLLAADAMICVSRSARDSFRKNLGLTRKIFAIPNGVDTDRFKPVGRKADGFRLLYVGRLSPEKGMRQLIKAFKIVRSRLECELCIVGDGPLRSLCTREAARTEGIKFLGTVSDDELVRLYSSSHLTIVPSVWQEAFGLVPIESMACETAPLAFDAGALPEIIKDGQTGFIVRKKTPAALAEGIISAARQDLSRIGKNGRKDVKKRFQWAKIAKETERVYKTVI